MIQKYIVHRAEKFFCFWFGYGPIKIVKVMLSQSVNLLALFLGKLCPLSISPIPCVNTFASNRQNSLFESQQKVENDQRNYFMITLHQNYGAWPQGYKTLFMLNSAEHETYFVYTS